MLQAAAVSGWDRQFVSAGLGAASRAASSWLAVATLVVAVPTSLSAETYAEKLGWGADDKVVILHVDDAGMSHDSNLGALRSIRHGVANSMSIMMPCPWVPELARELKAGEPLDAGLHLTLTSEWQDYCWGPLAGPDTAPGLIDERGCMWRSVSDVVANATPDEVEAEIRAQIARSRQLGIEPTHLDSHMGTLFATPEFLERYIRVGVDEGIPIMYPGGHNTALRAQYLGEQGSIPDRLEQSMAIGESVWEGGLPVLDDLHNTSYGWRPVGGFADRDAWARMKVDRYIEGLRRLKPGLTMVIMHSTDTSENFEFISTSGPTRQGDLDAMRDPRLEEFIEDEGIILTTWAELMERRRALED